MNPVFLALGALDIFAALCIIYPWMAGEFLFYIAFFMLAKAAFSMVASFAVGYYMDWMGFTDMLTGAVLVLMFFGISFDVFHYLGIFSLIKGIYCVGMTVLYR